MDHKEQRMELDIDVMHEIAVHKRFGLLPEILADEVEFKNPAGWRPLTGKADVVRWLEESLTLIQPMSYERTWCDYPCYALEFKGEVAGKPLQGVDLVTVNPAGKIVALEVLIRPVSALAALMQGHQTRA